MKRNIPAYSSKTNTSYPSWDDLVAAEANGYHVIVVATYTNGKRIGEVAFANSTEGGMTKKEAQNRAARLRKQDKLYRPYNYKFFVRPSWK